MSGFLGETLRFWVDLGLYDVFLPFIFVYTIVYAVLKQTKILGSQANINSLVAFCFGFIATASLQTVSAVQNFFSATGFLVIAGLCVMILLGMFGIKSLNSGNKWYHKLPKNALMLAIGLGFFYIVAVGLGFDDFLLNLIPSFSAIVTQTIIIGAVFVLIIWYIVGNTSSHEKTSAVPKASSSTEPSPIPREELNKHLVNEEKFEPGKPSQWNAKE